MPKYRVMLDGEVVGDFLAGEHVLDAMEAGEPIRQAHAKMTRDSRRAAAGNYRLMEWIDGGWEFRGRFG